MAIRFSLHPTPEWWAFFLMTLVVSALTSAGVSWSVATRVAPNSLGTIATSTTMTTSTMLNASPPVFTPPIAVDIRRGVSLFPTAITERKVSSVALLVRDTTLSQFKDRTLLQREHVVAYAVPMSADGWFMTTDAFMTRSRPQDLALVWNKTAYTPSSIVRDAYTGTVFFKISITNISASGIASRADTDLGSPVWIESRTPVVSLFTIDDITSSSVTPDTSVGDEVSRRYLVRASGEAPLGAPAWDGSGRLVGMVDGGSNGSWQILPAHIVNGTLASLLAGTPIKHATLGVRVMHDADFITGSASPLMRGGEVIAMDRRTGSPAIMRKGPLDGKLREGDVIERVERDVLDGSIELSELLLEYPIGTTITIHARRGTDGMDVTAVLGSVETGSVIK